jgi:hypothetical protein
MAETMVVQSKLATGMRFEVEAGSGHQEQAPIPRETEERVHPFERVNIILVIPLRTSNQPRSKKHDQKIRIWIYREKIRRGIRCVCHVGRNSAR